MRQSAGGCGLLARKRLTIIARNSTAGAHCCRTCWRDGARHRRLLLLDRVEQLLVLLLLLLLLILATWLTRLVVLPIREAAGL